VKIGSALLKSLIYRPFSWGIASVMYWIWFGQPAIIEIGLIVAAVEIAKAAFYLFFDVLWSRWYPSAAAPSAKVAKSVGPKS